MTNAIEVPATVDGYSLPRDYYTSSEIFGLDMEKLFFRNWLYAGHVSQIPNSGDYFTYELGEESILITRTAEGEIKGFFNVCRHRGARIMHEACGTARQFRCPYHNWTYNLDGSLKAAPGMKEQFQGEGLGQTDLGLRSVWIDVWQGFIYVNLSEEQPSHTLAEQLQAADAALADYCLPETKIAKTIQYDIPANWKLVMENYRECYHCRAAHPQFCATVPVDGLDAHRGQSDQRIIKKPFGSFTRFHLREGAVTQSVDGKSVSLPLGNLTYHDTMLSSLIVYPAHAFIFGVDYGFAFALQPKNATQTTLTAHWYVNSRATEGKDYDCDKVAEFWDITTKQDAFLCTINQQGINSRRYEPGPLHTGQEDDVAHFQKYYLESIAGES